MGSVGHKNHTQIPVAFCIRAFNFYNDGLSITGLTVYSITFPPTVFLNVLVLLGVYKATSLHTPSNTLLCGLALCDFATGALVVPLNIALIIAQRQNASSLYCILQTITSRLTGVFSGISFITVTLISVDRLIALRFHLMYSTVVTVPRVLSALLLTWLVFFVFVVLTIWIGYLPFLWCFASAIVLCLVICTVNNSLILRILRRHRVSIQSQQQQVQANENNDNTNMANRKKTSKTMLWVYLVFVLCTVPFSMRVMISPFSSGGGKKTSIIASILAGTAKYLMLANSLFNPIFYCIKMRYIRRQVLQILPTGLQSVLHVERTTSTT